MALLIHTHSDRGGRDYNEDAVSVTDAAPGTLLALADGLGGHAGGAEAAQACMQAASHFTAAAFAEGGLAPLFEMAEASIAARRGALNLPDTALRSTLTLLWLDGDQAQWAHVGDSRVYWFRHGVLQTRTRDHSVAELATRLHPHAPPDPADQHRLLRALGGAAAAPPELGAMLHDIQPGDAFLLCSDGVWDIVTDAELAATLAAAATPAIWCASIREILQTRVVAKNLAGHDNFSMIAAMVAD